jgi:effector-binding domain-containing protein
VPAYEIVRSVEPARRGVALVIDASWTRLEQATRHGLARLAVALARAHRAAGIDALAPYSTGALFPIIPAERVSVTIFALGEHDDFSVPLERLALPSGAALSTVHHGDHRLLGYAYRALLDHVAAMGLEVAGPVREHYGFDRDGVPCTRLVVPMGG